jgi:hypothetical protein
MTVLFEDALGLQAPRAMQRVEQQSERTVRCRYLLGNSWGGRSETRRN